MNLVTQPLFSDFEAVLAAFLSAEPTATLPENWLAETEFEENVGNRVAVIAAQGSSVRKAQKSTDGHQRLSQTH
ncbi:MAG: hypothetical protein VKK59_05825 [Vampirovibrionales bacterium]|nr:hypothetical protein [Vampirovibrionales bacterium]